MANGWEDWILSLRGEERLTVSGFAAPGYDSRKRIRGGLDGHLDGVGIRVTAASALVQSKRWVRLAGTPLEITLRPRGLSIDLREGDVVRAVRSPAGWRFLEPTDRVVLVACLFEWADMEYFLRTPGVRVL
ncbi:hypothetical protein [Streptomyces laurentii]|uniref:hypothetical protein n=1 Tax=Streptomyces laurentii TaxID=39478 RepID=UPI00369A7134